MYYVINSCGNIRNIHSYMQILRPLGVFICVEEKVMCMIELVDGNMGRIKSRKEYNCFIIPATGASDKTAPANKITSPTLLTYAVNILFWSGLFLLISFMFFD
jgi:hypothetical protein